MSLNCYWKGISRVITCLEAERTKEALILIWTKASFVYLYSNGSREPE